MVFYKSFWNSRIWKFFIFCFEFLASFSRLNERKDVLFQFQTKKKIGLRKFIKEIPSTYKVMKSNLNIINYNFLIKN